MSYRIANFLISLINIASSIISFFLGLRIILRFISVNPTTPVVEWVYSISSFFMNPFRGIVPDFSTGAGILDMVAVITLVAYLLVGYLLTEFLRNLSQAALEEPTHSTVHYHDIDEDLENQHHKQAHSK